MEYVELLKNAWSSISNYFNYHNILNENQTNLREKRKRLECREHDINTELENAQYSRGKKARKEVENWLMEVQLVKDSVQRIEQEVGERRYLSRLRFLSQFEANVRKVDEMFELGNFPNGILIDVPHRGEQNALLTEPLIGETTAKRNFEKIWTCLEKGEIQSIGIWGMGGIGKTTIVTHIHNCLLEEKDAFGAVYWVTVSKYSSISKLQDAVAGKINLDLSKEEDERIRAALLFEALQKEKKFVLIFDDVWEVYPPREVGIPDGGRGRLIVTTRSRKVCLKMGCKEIIQVERLHKEEAWKLFNKTLDRYNPLCQKEEEIAKDIVEECAGLPLAIVTTARSISGAYDIAEWRNALNELRKRVKGHAVDLEDDVFKILEFSYSRLNDEKLQECLLYCALFPEDYEIRRIDLIHYWIAERLVEEMGSKQDERDRGHAILNKLENVSLLERCQNGKYVKMHDVIRDMAINITGRSRRFMVKTRININMEDLLPTEQTEWSNNNNNLERVSLIDSRFSYSMSVPNFNCPKLSTLLLQKLPRFLSPREDEGLPNSFFMNMEGLKVLDLSDRNIEFLPDSIIEMVNLRALILFRCERLKQIGSLEKLTELRMLDLGQNNLERLPDGIDKLVHLKEFYWTSNVIERPITPIISHLLPNLVHLQSLVLHDKRFSDVGTKELSGLRKLEILSISFSDLHNFNTYFRKLPCPRLTHYRVLLNGVRSRYTSCGLCKEVGVRKYRLIGGKENDDHQLVLPANLQVLELHDCELLPNGIGLLDVSPYLKTAMDLKACEISYCQGIEYVWWADDCIASLNTLSLEALPDLRVLFKLRPTENIVSCSSLKHLYVHKCHNLKHLFTAELVKSYHLQNLESIIVFRCNQMEDIIILAEVEEEKGINNDLILCFPNLRTLCLRQVPKLKSIWKGKMTCASIQLLSVEHCPNLRRLPLSSHTTIDFDGEVRASTPPFKEIRGQKQWWDEVEWELKSLFQPLFKHIASKFSFALFEEIFKVHERIFHEIYEQL